MTVPRSIAPSPSHASRSPHSDIVDEREDDPHALGCERCQGHTSLMDHLLVAMSPRSLTSSCAERRVSPSCRIRQPKRAPVHSHSTAFRQPRSSVSGRYGGRSSCTFRRVTAQLRLATRSKMGQAAMDSNARATGRFSQEAEQGRQASRLAGARGVDLHLRLRLAAVRGEAG
jgi:hypothetical protein